MRLQNQGLTEDSKEVKQLKYDVICLLKQLSKPLDGQITAHKRKVLIGKGAVSHAQAIKKAEQEFEIYRQREMEMLESDFDREIKKLKEKNAPSSTTEGIKRFKNENVIIWTILN